MKITCEVVFQTMSDTHPLSHVLMLPEIFGTPLQVFVRDFSVVQLCRQTVLTNDQTVPRNSLVISQHCLLRLFCLGINGRHGNMLA